MDSLTKEFEYEVGKDIDKVENEVRTFYADLQFIAPRDTGHFLESYKMDSDKEKLTWEISNSAEYASILWMGRRYLPISISGWSTSRSGGSSLSAQGKTGRLYGSLGWPEGGEPMYEEFKYNLEHL